MSSYPAGIGAGGDSGASLSVGSGATIGLAKAVVVIDTSQLEQGAQDAQDAFKGIGDAAGAAGEQVDQGTEKASAGLEGVAQSSGRASGGLRTLLTASRLVSMTGDKSAAQAIRTVGYIGIVSQRLGGMGDTLTGLAGPIEKIGQDILTWGAAQLGLDEEIAGTIVEVGGLAVGIAAFAAPIGIAVAGLVAISNEFTAVSEAAKEGEQQLKDYYNVLSQGKTSDQLNETVDTLTNKVNIAQQAYNKALTDQSNEALQLVQNYGTQGAGIVNLIAQTGLYGSTQKDLGAAVASTKTELDKLTTQLNATKAAADSSATHLADLNAAFTKNTQDMIQEDQKAATQAIANQKLIQSGNLKNLTDQIQTNKDQYDSQTALAAQLQSKLEAMKTLEEPGIDTTKSIVALQGAIDTAKKSADEAKTQLDLLNGTVGDSTKATGLFNGVLKDFGSGLKSAFTDLSKMPSAINAFSQSMQKFQDLVQSHNEELMNTSQERQLQANRQLEDQQRTDLRAKQDFQRTLAEEDKKEAETQAKGLSEAYKKYGPNGLDQQKELQNEQKSLETYYKDSAKAAQTYQDDLLKIQQQGHTSIIKDAAHLNAEAVFNDQTKQRQDTDNATKKYDEEKATRDKNEEQTLEDMKKNAEASRNQNLADALQRLSDEKTQYEQSRQQKITQNNETIKRQEEDRALAAKRQQEDFKREDLAKQQAYDKQYNDLVKQLLGPEQTAKLKAYAADKKNLQGTLNDMSTMWNNFRKTVVTPIQTGLKTGANGAVLKFQTGTPTVPSTGLFQLEAGEGVMTPAVAQAARNVLGSSYTQADLMNVFQGNNKAGISINNFAPQIILGDIGGRSDNQVKQLIMDAMHDIFVRLANGGIT